MAPPGPADVAVAPVLPARSLRLGLPDPTVPVAVVLLAVLVFLVANPLYHLLHFSLSDPGGHGLTLGNYAAAFGRPRYVQAMVNSLELGAVAAAIGAVLAVPMAWAVSRTDLPGRRVFHGLVVGSFLIPPFVGAIGWILLGGPNAGWLNRAWVALTGAAAGPFNVFSFTGLAVVTALYSYPLIYVFTRSSLDLVPTDMEEAAAILGAGALRTTLGVTLPLAMPAITGAILLVFLEALGLYGTPALLAIPAGFNVVTTQLAAFFENPIRLEVASAYSMPLVGITVVLLWLQRRMLRRRSFVTVSGKGGSREPLRLGAWRWMLFAYAVAVTGATVALPLLVLLQTAFSRAWAQPMSAANFTLDNLRQAFLQETVRGALLNTIDYALLTATACTVLGFGVGYVTQRRLLPWAGLWSAVTLAPFAVPGIVLAICFYAAYAVPPFSLYGLGTLVVIAFTTRFVPISFTNAGAAVGRLNPELEEAVRIAGGSRVQALWRVVLPVLRGPVFGSWLLVFIVATRELSTAVFLSGPQSRVVSVLTLELSEQGQYEQLAAISVLLLLVTGAVALAGTLMLGRDFMDRRP